MIDFKVPRRVIFLVILLCALLTSGCSGATWQGKLGITTPAQLAGDSFVDAGLIKYRDLVGASFMHTPTYLETDIKLESGEKSTFYARVESKIDDKWSSVSQLTKVNLQSLTIIKMNDDFEEGKFNTLRISVWGSRDSSASPLASSKAFLYKFWTPDRYDSVFNSIRREYNSELYKITKRYSKQIRYDWNFYGNLDNKNRYKDVMQDLYEMDYELNDLYKEFQTRIFPLGIVADIKSELFEYMSTYSNLMKFEKTKIYSWCSKETDMVMAAYKRCTGDLSTTELTEQKQLSKIYVHARKNLLKRLREYVTNSSVN